MIAKNIIKMFRKIYEKDPSIDTLNKRVEYLEKVILNLIKEREGDMK